MRGNRPFDQRLRFASGVVLLVISSALFASTAFLKAFAKLLVTRAPETWRCEVRGAFRGINFVPVQRGGGGTACGAGRVKHVPVGAREAIEFASAMVRCSAAKVVSRVLVANGPHAFWHCDFAGPAARDMDPWEERKHTSLHDARRRR